MYSGSIIILMYALYAEQSGGSDDFELLSGEDFNLLDNSNFLLLGTG